MDAGRIVAALPAERLDAAEPPYTRGRLGAMPRIHAPRRRLETLRRDPAQARAPGIAAA